MKSIATKFASITLLFAIAAPASALIDPALEAEFLAAATRAVTEADRAAAEIKQSDVDIQKAADSNGETPILIDEVIAIPED